MSKVISFRLDKNNPREAKALEVLKNKRDEGYNIRHIIMEALINLDETNPHLESPTTKELFTIVMKVHQLLERIKGDDELSLTREAAMDTNLELTENLVSSVKKTIKPGLHLESR
jgi:hypothetical protein